MNKLNKQNLDESLISENSDLNEMISHLESQTSRKRSKSSFRKIYGNLIKGVYIHL